MSTPVAISEQSPGVEDVNIHDDDETILEQDLTQSVRFGVPSLDGSNADASTGISAVLQRLEKKLDAIGHGQEAMTAQLPSLERDQRSMENKLIMLAPMMAALVMEEVLTLRDGLIATADDVSDINQSVEASRTITSAARDAARESFRLAMAHEDKMTDGMLKRHRVALIGILHSLQQCVEQMPRADILEHVLVTVFVLSSSMVLYLEPEIPLAIHAAAKPLSKEFQDALLNYVYNIRLQLKSLAVNVSTIDATGMTVTMVLISFMTIVFLQHAADGAVFATTVVGVYLLCYFPLLVIPSFLVWVFRAA